MARGNRPGHRRFGLIRKLPSGRYQASYLGPDGRRRAAPDTFARKREAEQWLAAVETELLRDDWTDPALGKIPLREFAEQWIAEHKISRRTREEYASVWRLHLASYLGDYPIGQISTDLIRSWRATLLREGRSEDRTAKAYRLLRAVLNTAVDDGLIKRNPCRIKGAGQHRTPERPTATVAQVTKLSGLVPPRFRVLVLAAAFTGLRWGELVALRRCDIDLDGGAVHVYRRLAEHKNGEIEAGPTKSVAGARTVALPDVLVTELREHIAEYAEDGTEGLVFTGDRDGPLRRGNFHRATAWTRTVVAAGLPSGFHFHDLRHTGNHLAATAGASTRELMHRMGHGSMRAALIYQHATTERDRAIAQRLNDLVQGDEDSTEDDVG
ncbi:MULTISPECIES: tyrosine-type recombinase/integrase [Pseudonocardia]|uniref:Site-specific recombinase XerD n=2 Tax=Pseudonocardia TaxID=1847 RepID=A0A1I5IBY2_PSUAM|nr:MULTISPECIES: site-specific integrase [Pseudonocardia]OLM20099.1 Phage integrase, site-specific tyrosine recombinase [Pseudonocardia sp. Ae707_Ps1]OSY34697.1 putative prophage phiRv2 integrase [Pseudonocardia autotrophica]TDN73244.1 site-specific recombinase XerD [Pseudonocardia autotrophica]SFO58013.1 Site-specific recombinase XerD [Pseudonocardia ammonioxydans]BBG03977.1 putative prophage phiRv2 integrase [Pseudonocardia autotrophica]